MDHNTLIAHLARVLPSWADRQAVVRGSGLKDVQIAGDALACWQLLMDEAERQGRTEQLLKAAFRARPRDRVIAAAAGEDAASVVRGSSWGVWAALGVLVAAAGVGAMWNPEQAPEKVDAPASEGVRGGRPAASASSDLPGATGSASTPAPLPLNVPVPPPPSAKAAAATAAAAAAAAVPAGEPLAAPAPAVVAPPKGAPPASGEEKPLSSDDLGRLASIPQPAVAEPAAAPAVPKASKVAAAPKGAKPACGASGGYAYVADGNAPRMGEVWSVPRSINVRVDYPRAANGWDSKSEVVCVLPPGTKVPVSGRPVPVEGGAVWVPVSGAWVE